MFILIEVSYNLLAVIYTIEPILQRTPLPIYFHLVVKTPLMKRRIYATNYRTAQPERGRMTF